MSASDKWHLLQQLAEGVFKARQAARLLLQDAGQESETLEEIEGLLHSIGDDSRPERCSGLIAELTYCDSCGKYDRQLDDYFQCRTCVENFESSQEEDCSGPTGEEKSRHELKRALAAKEGR